MPELMLFGICRMAIIERDNNAVSLITLLTGLSAVLVEGSSPSAEDMIPFPWSAVTAWLAEPNDVGAEFEQRVEITMPNGKKALQTEIQKFGFPEGHRFHQVTSNSFGFPVGQSGDLVFRVLMRKVGTEKWKRFGKYVMLVGHQFQQSETTGDPK